MNRFADALISEEKSGLITVYDTIDLQLARKP